MGQSKANETATPYSTSRRMAFRIQGQAPERSRIWKRSCWSIPSRAVPRTISLWMLQTSGNWSLAQASSQTSEMVSRSKARTRLAGKSWLNNQTQMIWHILKATSTWFNHKHMMINAMTRTWEWVCLNVRARWNESSGWHRKENSSRSALRD